MLRRDLGEYYYKGYDVYDRPHPKLYGRWEIYKGETFICRAMHLKEARESIDAHWNTEKEKRELLNFLSSGDLSNQ